MPVKHANKIRETSFDTFFVFGRGQFMLAAGAATVPTAAASVYHCSGVTEDTRAT